MAGKSSKEIIKEMTRAFTLLGENEVTFFKPQMTKYKGMEDPDVQIEKDFMELEQILHKRTCMGMQQPRHSNDNKSNAVKLIKEHEQRQVDENIKNSTVPKGFRDKPELLKRIS